MSKSVHFEGLDTLRSIAAITVVINHIETYRIKYGNEILDLGKFSFYNISALVGVMLFFTLSGFLITYLLLKEKQKTNTIDVKGFYIRRILRVWPLYFFVLIVSILILPLLVKNYHGVEFLSDDSFYLRLFFCVIIMPNFLRMFGISGFVGFNQTWSVGVEEQFYLIWPNIIKFSKKHLNLILIIIFLFFTFIGHFFNFLYNHIEGHPVIFKMLFNFFITFKINCMALGGLGANLYYNKSKLLNIIYNKYVEVGTILITFVLWFVIGFNPPLCDEFYSVLLLIVILNVATNPNKIVSMNWNVTNFLGKISYGIYMYHMICLVLLNGIGDKYFKSYFNNEFTGIVIINILTLFSTIIVSHLSYKFLETPFIKLKSKYQVIKSS
jgi:peptidoglycan/LPS O-acetylase OafA/YrhL